MSLDMCADQYVLALIPRDRILALSDRARLPESYYRERAGGIRIAAPSLESLLALDPDVVVRTWAGDFKLIRELERRGIRVVTINDVSTLEGARTELLRVGDEMGQGTSARIEAHHMSQALERLEPFGQGRRVIYYTPSGYSAGKGTFIADMLETLGFTLAFDQKGFFSISPETLLGLEADAYALGFYDDIHSARRAPGRNPAVMKKIQSRPHIQLPGTAIACSAWYSAYELDDITVTEGR